MAISICIDTHVCIISKVKGIDEEKEICLHNREYISCHRLERINMVIKCIVHMHITAELKAYWLLAVITSNNCYTVNRLVNKGYYIGAYILDITFICLNDCLTLQVCTNIYVQLYLIL